MTDAESHQALDDSRRELFEHVAHLLLDYEKLEGKESAFERGFSCALIFAKSQMGCYPCTVELDNAEKRLQELKDEIRNAFAITANREPA